IKLRGPRPKPPPAWQHLKLNKLVLATLKGQHQRRGGKSPWRSQLIQTQQMP
ncbi:hypothetical protein APHAL10511_005037, partial [Amanita phalloides]